MRLAQMSSCELQQNPIRGLPSSAEAHKMLRRLRQLHNQLAILLENVSCHFHTIIYYRPPCMVSRQHRQAAAIHRHCTVHGGTHTSLRQESLCSSHGNTLHITTVIIQFNSHPNHCALFRAAAAYILDPIPELVVSANAPLTQNPYRGIILHTFSNLEKRQS